MSWTDVKIGLKLESDVPGGKTPKLQMTTGIGLVPVLPITGIRKFHLAQYSSVQCTEYRGCNQCGCFFSHTTPIIRPKGSLHTVTSGASNLDTVTALISHRQLLESCMTSQHISYEFLQSHQTHADPPS